MGKYMVDVDFGNEGFVKQCGLLRLIKLVLDHSKTATITIKQPNHRGS